MNASFVFPLRQLPWWIGLALLVLGAIGVALAALEHRRRRRLASFVEANLAPRLAMGYDVRLRRPLHWFSHDRIRRARGGVRATALGTGLGKHQPAQPRCVGHIGHFGEHARD